MVIHSVNLLYYKSLKTVRCNTVMVKNIVLNISLVAQPPLIQQQRNNCQKLSLPIIIMLFLHLDLVKVFIKSSETQQLDDETLFITSLSYCL